MFQGFNKEVDDENQRRKEAQERDAAVQQRLTEEHKERMTEKREEFSKNVKTIENADIRGAEQAKGRLSYSNNFDNELVIPLKSTIKNVHILFKN